MSQHPGCGQCGRPAVCSVSNVNLCVDCFSRFQSAMAQQSAHAMAMMNYALDEMDAITGLGGLYPSPRVKIPSAPPILNTQPITFHNINVQGSVVGAINTGQVQEIDVALDHIKLGGDTNLAESLKQFTEALIANAELQEAAKAEVLEQVSFLSAQAAAKKEERKPGMIRRALEDVSKVVTMSNALAALWEKLHPLLSAL